MIFRMKQRNPLHSFIDSILKILSIDVLIQPKSGSPCQATRQPRSRLVAMA
jgi:hypothetical protein